MARNFFVPVADDAPGGPHLYPGAPIRFSALAAPPLTRAPRLGEHTADVLGEQA
jgi:crotonobetainyl-CoA:carnitine CoA-transferase CaiB-like acyl-CoA transferase